MSEGSGGGSPFPWGLTPAGAGEARDEPDAVIPERAPSEFLPPAATAAPADIPEREPTELLLAAGVPGAVVPAAAVEPVPAPVPEPAASEPASAPSTEPESGGAVDALFGDTRFQEFDEGLVPVRSSRDRPPPPRGARVAARPSGFSTTQKRIISVAGVLVAILALVGLFFLGTRLPALLSASRVTATSSPIPTPTPTPTPTAVPVGPVAAGVHGWNELRGGECLDPYTSPWAEKFTVVDCAVAHPSQMVFRGTFDPTTTPTFPGAPALQTQISLLCAAPGVLDLAAAGQYADAQVQGSYPVTQEEWTAGQHDYFCFVSRSSGQPLTGSVAVVKAAVPAPAP